MQERHFKLLALVIFFLSLVYGFYMIFQAFDFVKEAYIYTGLFALIFLNLSLFFSLFSFKKTRVYPRLLGIFASIWAILHFLNYFIFDKNAQLLRLLDDISKRFLEASGFISFVLLMLMFISSFKFFKKMHKIRKLAYLCLLCASYHYFLTPKVPMFWEYTALALAIFYILWRYKPKNLRFYSYQNSN
ncbi:ferric reductase [Campylobacter sp. MIT 99-7217]|uniref:ferric reductase-like transmembrane domain-containing protein n=1 Tax=Campylobacter sp. MIT 99-7217 TaxID=535091 RepID=UPI00115827F2|nr:ferric reductase-like transmembrane domain-containing protein [Campylobacter sp. MIT 99-7217]TQR34517.1 ferric reductase [Campylobacter sp. MIT 99-7217]